MPAQKEVVSCFIVRDGKILLVKRSSRTGSYRGLWSVISGYLEEKPLEQALREIQEETGLSEWDIELVARGHPLLVEDGGLAISWKIYPFLFSYGGRSEIKLNWENEEYRWIKAGKLADYPTVPGLKDALDRVYPPK